MKAKKLLGYLVFLLIASAFVTVIDYFIGVKFTDVGAWAQFTHKLTYILFGSAFYYMNKWLCT
ncbi:MAG: hypothetical protein HYY55_01255 [Candidatus Niyogibacteria bacterium]|nr:MAG: hypothetical protein HYY55_01255 [Candidatus Niyogibacteria bacterium]